MSEATKVQRTISYEKFLMLEAILTLAASLNQDLKNAKRAALEITGEEDHRYYCGYTTDAIYSSDMTARKLLDRLDIQVEDAPQS